jgi:hypothetical protein
MGVIEAEFEDLIGTAMGRGEVIDADYGRSRACVDVRRLGRRARDGQAPSSAAAARDHRRTGSGLQDRRAHEDSPADPSYDRHRSTMTDRAITPALHPLLRSPLSAVDPLEYVNGLGE